MAERMSAMFTVMTTSELSHSTHSRLMLFIFLINTSHNEAFTYSLVFLFLNEEHTVNLKVILGSQKSARWLASFSVSISNTFTKLR